MSVVATPNSIVDVCLCTYNPHLPTLKIAIDALARQTLAKDRYRVWIVDNNSEPPITTQDLQALELAGVEYHLVPEPRLGVIHARQKGITSTESELVVFLDDDNELSEDYLEQAIALAQDFPEVGCFGGKLRLPEHTVYPAWAEGLLPCLAIRDLGDLPIVKQTETWGEWQPPFAGLVARRVLLNFYLEQLADLDRSGFSLGRKGRNGLLSAEDSFLTRSAIKLDLYCGYYPQLKLTHHVAPHRFKLGYLVRLLYAYGRSHIILERAMGHKVEAVVGLAAVKYAIQRSLIRARLHRRTLRYGLCQLAWDLGCMLESGNERLDRLGTDK
jgi:glycosyltransferase involved in cell wall biosynthesis